MMRMIQRAVVCVAVLVATAGQSQAALITVDPDGFTTGTDLTSAFSGVTITQGGESTGVTAGLGLTGSQQFNIYGDPGSFTYLPIPPLATLAATLAASVFSPNILRFEFDTPTDFVSLDLIPNDSDDPGSISAFDIAGNLIGYASFGGQNLYGQRNTLSISGAGIKTLLAAGDNLGNNLQIDTLVYNSASTSAVPEPTSLALLGIGACAAGLGAARRRRRDTKQETTA